MVVWSVPASGPFHCTESAVSMIGCSVCGMVMLLCFWAISRTDRYCRTAACPNMGCARVFLRARLRDFDARDRLSLGRLCHQELTIVRRAPHRCLEGNPS